MKYWINDIFGIIEAVVFKLGTVNVHNKRHKMTPLVLLPWQQFCRWRIDGSEAEQYGNYVSSK